MQRTHPSSPTNSRGALPSRRPLRVALAVLGCVVALATVGWLGLQVPAPAPPATTLSPGPLETVPLPRGLPAPVARFYREVSGETVPVVRSAILVGRARMRLFGLEFPARFLFVHDAGHAYRHYFEVTWFGVPIFRVNEHFLDGHARLELPMGVQQGPHTDQGANLALWAEALSFPALYLTDPRVGWSAVDQHTALLTVPFGDTLEHFLARFDPQSGLLSQLEAMRYQDESDASKQLWIAQASQWSTLGGQRLPVEGSALWLEQGRPWASFTTEQVVLNADVNTYVRARGW